MRGYTQKIIPALMMCLLVGIPVGRLIASKEGELRHDAPVDARSHTEKTLRQISHVVDLWHEAVLRSQKSRADRMEQSLRTLIWADIAANQRELKQFAREIAVRHAGDNKSEVSVDSVDKNRKTNAKPAQSFSRFKRLLRAKERLSESFVRTRAFSNKYRLAENYMELLRKQLGQERRWLAKKDRDRTDP